MIPICIERGEGRRTQSSTLLHNNHRWAFDGIKIEIESFDVCEASYFHREPQQQVVREVEVCQPDGLQKHNDISKMKNGVSKCQRGGGGKLHPAGHHSPCATGTCLADLLWDSRDFIEVEMKCLQSKQFADTWQYVRERCLELANGSPRGTTERALWERSSVRREVIPKMAGTTIRELFRMSRNSSCPSRS